MRWLEWIISDPLAQMTVLAVALTVAVLIMVARRTMTGGRSPALKYLLYTSLAWLMFALPCTYFWRHKIMHRGPSGPLLHSVPNATFKTSTGKMVTLESLRGRVVLLDFWASWCVPCRSSSPAIAQMQAEFGPQLVTISVDEDEPEADWRKALVGPRPTYDVRDEENQLGSLFRLEALPKFVVLNRAGAVESIENGWEPDTGARLRNAVQQNLATPTNAQGRIP